MSSRSLPRRAVLAHAGAPRPRRRVAGLLLAVLSVAGLAGAVACGKKGDPQAPLRPVPQRTEQLAVAQRGANLLLSLPYPKVTAAGMALPGLDRLEVYEVVRPAPRELTVPAGEAASPASPDAPQGQTPEESTGETVPPAPAPPAPEPPATAPPPAPQTALPPAATPATAPPAPTGLQPLDARQFNASAKPRLTLAGPDLAAATVGDRIVFALALPQGGDEAPQAHWLAVRTVSGDDRSELSNQAAIVTRPPPAAPTDLVVMPGPDGIEIGWSPGARPGADAAAAATSATGFNIYRRDAATHEFAGPVGTAGAEVTSWVDRTASLGSRYIYAVTAVAERAPLVESAIAAVREVDYRDRFAPEAPGGLVALAEEGRVRLVWEAVRAADLAGYRVLRRSATEGDFHSLTEEPIAATEYDDANVTPGAHYSWRVVAVDRAGNASEAAEIAADAR